VRLRTVLAAWGAACWPALAAAHGSRLGDIVVDHPYATPTLAGARTGAAYLRGLADRGRQPDRLIGAELRLRHDGDTHPH